LYAFDITALAAQLQKAPGVGLPKDIDRSSQRGAVVQLFDVLVVKADATMTGPFTDRGGAVGTVGAIILGKQTAF